METPTLFFHTESTPFSLPDESLVTSWLKQIISHYEYEEGPLNFIFTSDDYLLEVNKQHLDHDYYTDIITFDYTDRNLVSGDVFISIDRVKDNATERQIAFRDELHRVMAHGLLHLIGYTDKDPEAATTMRAQEDYCLNLRDF